MIIWLFIVLGIIGFIIQLIFLIKKEDIIGFKISIITIILFLLAIFYYILKI